MGNFLEPGTRVRYVPGHANGDHDHCDCESGIITSVKAETVFVQFDKDVSAVGHGATAKACDRYDLHAIDEKADTIRDLLKTGKAMMQLVEAIQEGQGRHDPDEECPYCMGELLDDLPIEQWKESLKKAETLT